MNLWCPLWFVTHDFHSPTVGTQVTGDNRSYTEAPVQRALGKHIVYWLAHELLCDTKQIIPFRVPVLLPNGFPNLPRQEWNTMSLSIEQLRVALPAWVWFWAQQSAACTAFDLSILWTHCMWGFKKKYFYYYSHLKKEVFRPPTVHNRAMTRDKTSVFDVWQRGPDLWSLRAWPLTENSLSVQRGLHSRIEQLRRLSFRTCGFQTMFGRHFINTTFHSSVPMKTKQTANRTSGHSCGDTEFSDDLSEADPGADIYTWPMVKQVFLHQCLWRTPRLKHRHTSDTRPRSELGLPPPPQTSSHSVVDMCVYRPTRSTC